MVRTNKAMDLDNEWDMEEGEFDGAGAALQMHTFLDEWHFRVLHAGMADQVDRIEAVEAALTLFEAHGISFIPEELDARCREKVKDPEEARYRQQEALAAAEKEKRRLALLDEEEMVSQVVGLMSGEMRKNFEHFALQLQLIVSTATRVRGALEAGDIREVTKIMEEGDAGITNQILKRTCVEASLQISELKDVHDGWADDMRSRLGRLSSLSKAAEKNSQELTVMNAEIAAFQGKQNQKAMKAVTSMCDQSNSVLCQAAFSAWWTHCVRSRADKHLHEKFEAEIARANMKLKEIEGSSIAGVKRALMGNVNQSNHVLLGEVVRQWWELLANEKKEKEERLKIDAENAHFETLRTQQKARAKQSMLRMAGDSEESLKSITFTAWANVKEELRKEKEFQQQEEALQKQLKEMQQKGRAGSQSVLKRMCDSSNENLIANCFRTWKEEYQTEKKAREVEETIQKQGAKFKSLNEAQKGNAMGRATSAITLEELNTKMHIFMSWMSQVEWSRVIGYYSDKVHSKKDELDKVHNLFKKFVSKFEEQGLADQTKASIGPGQSKGSRSKSSDKHKPPVAPAVTSGAPSPTSPSE